MSDYELVIKGTKALEAQLEQLGASGRGLHEKVSSVEGKLPAPLVKRLRFVATVRNKLVHEDSYDALDDREGWVQACNACYAELQAMVAPPASKSGCLGLLLGLLIPTFS